MKTVARPSGERVPALGMGTWHMGDDASLRREEVATLQLGLGLGARLIDTAERYGHGLAEELGDLSLTVQGFLPMLGLMRKAKLTAIAWLVLGLSLAAPGRAGAGTPPSFDEELRLEQGHFCDCLAYLYNPALWISYNDSLYFLTRTAAQDEQVATIVAARAQYQVFTNLQARHDFAAGVLAESGLPTNWQAKILLPYSATNRSLLPHLERPRYPADHFTNASGRVFTVYSSPDQRLYVVDRYQVMEARANGDALIQAAPGLAFVLNFGRAEADAWHTNALLLKEGLRTYGITNQQPRTVEAFSDVGLNRQEAAVLNRAVAAFQAKAVALSRGVVPPRSPPATAPVATLQSKAPAATPSSPPADVQARQEFEYRKARASASSPYTEYDLALAYLQGRGTEKDEKLGLEWMKKAAEDGSGDASAYLEKLKAAK